jgi:drug/metabolite transporter (DMT)-like permease
MSAVSERTTETDRAAANTRGVLAMVASMATFSVSDMLLKLAGNELPVGQIIFMRGVFASAIVLTLAATTGALAEGAKFLKSEKRTLIYVRTFAEVGATICFLTGLVQLPFAEASAITQFVPLALTAAAAIFLGEPVGWRRWLAALVGFIGVMIIIKPGTAAFHPAALWTVTSMVFAVVRDLTTRQIGARVPSFFLISFSSVAVMLSACVFLPFETWSTPGPVASLLILGSAICAIGGFYTIIVAMQSGDIGVVAPFRYSIAIFAIFFGIVVFGERPPLSTYVGIAIVIGAGLYTLHRERVRKRSLTQ